MAERGVTLLGRGGQDVLIPTVGFGNGSKHATRGMCSLETYFIIEVGFLTLNRQRVGGVNRRTIEALIEH